MNDMGLVLFTKYALRIQRIGLELMSGKPIRAGAAMFGLEVLQDTLGWDPETILDKSVIFGTKPLWFMPGVDKIVGDITVPHLYENIARYL